MPLSAAELVLRQWQWSAGPLQGRAEQLLLRGLSLTQRPGGLQAVFVDSVDVAQARLTGTLLPQPLPAGAWELPALQDAAGSLRAFVTDAAWMVDADITLPVQHGRLAFDQVTVSHVGPDSSMGLSRGGLYVDAPHLGRRYLYVFTAAQVPGAAFEQRAEQGARIEYRGAIDLHAFAAAMLAGAWRGLGRPADPSSAQLLDRTRLSGELQLGDGLVASPLGRLVLSGKTVGHNRVAVASSAAGRELQLRLPALQADEMALETAQGRLTTGALRAQLELSLTPPRAGNGEWRFELRVAEASAQRVMLTPARSASPARAASAARVRSG